MTAQRSWDGGWRGYPDVDEAPPAPSGPGRGAVSDFVLFALLPMAELRAGSLPANELAMGVAVALATLRPVRQRPVPAWLMVMLPAMLGLMGLSAYLNDLTPIRRMLHLTLYVVLAVYCAQGRFHVRSMARGLAAGLLISAGAYFAGFGTSYSGRLAGLMSDPNAAGYLLTTLGCLALAGMRPGRVRLATGLLIATAVVLTFSRTSLLAMLLVLVWVGIGRRFAAGLGSMILFAMIYVVTNVPISLQTFGPFADRSGSDALRGRIVAQEKLDIASAPWYGHGPGTSRVEVLGTLFYYHSSYLAVLNEGGRIAQLLLVGAGAFGLIGLLRQRVDLRNPWYESAVIAVAVCAVNLGEVLLELPAALALGMAAYHVLASRSAAAATGPPDDPLSRSRQSGSPGALGLRL